jgi:prepilin-type N-terminal cleavage/methylation domain-containing protein
MGRKKMHKIVISEIKKKKFITHFPSLMRDLHKVYSSIEMRKERLRKKRGFSLVELAIVLVIMGLLAVGATSGRSMLRAAELKTVISNVETYKIALDNFKLQYEGLPGDLKNATSFWAGATNGNGDGKIGTGAVTDDTEAYYIWDHLSKAQLVSGVFSGSGTAAVIGTNVPAAKSVTGAGYSIVYQASPFSYADELGRSFSANYIILGANHASDNYLSTSSLNPDDAFYIDSKIDDGTPDFGTVLGGLGNGASGTCTTGSAPNILYNFTNSGTACILEFSLYRQ